MKVLIQELTRSLNFIWRWFRFLSLSMWPLWLACVVIFLPVITLNMEEPQAWLRRCGLFLQILGFVITALGLAGRGRVFGRSFKAWLTYTWDRRPRARLPIIAAMSARMEMDDTLSARGYVSASKEAPIEVRLSRVEDTLRALHDEVGRNDNEQKISIQEVKRGLLRELSEVKAGLARQEKQMMDALVGDVHLEWIGVMAFVIGVTIATVPEEISAVF